MRKSMPAVLLIGLTGCMPIVVNSGLPGTDYSALDTKTVSGDPVLRPDTLVQATARTIGNGMTSFRTVRVSILSTGLTNATWTHVQGIYLPIEQLENWATHPPRGHRPRLSPEAVTALLRCAPDLGNYQSLPVAAVNAASRFGRVSIGTGSSRRTYVQYLTSRTEWRTELDQGPSGGANNVRILPVSFELFGSAAPIPTSRSVVVNVDIAFRFSQGTEAGYRFASGAADLSRVRTSCSAAGELTVRGLTIDQQPTGWLPIARTAYNLHTTVTEQSR